MHVFAAAHKVSRSRQKCAVILDRHQASHAADHDAPCGNAKLLPDLPGALGTREKPLRIHAVMNQTKFVSRAPGLPGMIVPQVPRHGEDRVGHRVTTTAEQPAPERETPEGFQFVSVFAVDGNWNPGHPGSGNRFKRTEITCVNDVPPKFTGPVSSPRLCPLMETSARGAGRSCGLIRAASFSISSLPAQISGWQEKNSASSSGAPAAPGNSGFRFVGSTFS